MYTGTFTFMPADKDWKYDPNKNLYHNCPAHHQFEVNVVSWRLEVSELELTYDDTENVMIIDGHTLPGYFADGFPFANRLQQLLSLLFGLVTIFV